MQHENKERPYNIVGMRPVLFASIIVSLIVLFSVMGYVCGLVKMDDSYTPKVEVEVKTDSALMEVIRGQVKIEMEMLKVINENTNKVPTVNNVIRPRCAKCAPQVINSFNHNIVGKDSLSR